MVFMSDEVTEHTTLNFRSVFWAKYGMWWHYFLLDYYNFKVYVTFSQLRTEQFCYPTKCAIRLICKTFITRNSKLKGKKCNNFLEKTELCGFEKCTYIQVHGEILQWCLNCMVILTHLCMTYFSSLTVESFTF
jgi:hypothetical protein